MGLSGCPFYVVAACTYSIWIRFQEIYAYGRGGTSILSFHVLASRSGNLGSFSSIVAGVSRPDSLELSIDTDWVNLAFGMI